MKTAPIELLLVTRAVYGLHGYGGLERHCADWIHTMCDLGCRVHVITAVPQDPDSLSAFPPNALFYFLPAMPARSVLSRITYYPAWARRAGQLAAKVVKTSEIAAVYAQGLAASGCPGLGAPLFYNPHGMEEFKCSAVKRWAYSKFRKLSIAAASSADRVIATDEVLVAEILRYLKAAPHKVSVIPNAIRIEAAAPERNPDSDRTTFLAVGRLEANKGLDILLKAIARATALPADWQLLIAGSGSQQRRLQSLSRSLGLSGKVAFCGPIDDPALKRLYTRAHVFINPTLYEGSSIVTLEAMGHGLPVIASRTGGIPDKVYPGENGWLAVPGDPKSLADAIDEACRAREKWIQMGEASFRIVRERFTWDIAARRFLNLVAEIGENHKDAVKV